MRDFTMARWLTLFSMMTVLSAPVPAFAVSADLAKKCRAMAIKTYPSARIGSKTGNSKAQFTYYRTCLDNNGTMPETPAQPAAK
jgi:hypothetical protein